MARFLLSLSHSKLLWALCALSMVGQLFAQTPETSVFPTGVEMNR